VEIEPSIYAADFARLGEELEALLDAGARVFQFDMGDGHFIPEVTIGPVVLKSIAELVHEGGGVLDCHLMVSEPVRHFEAVGAAGGDSVTFHLEAVDDVSRATAAARALGLGVGLAFNPGTSVERAVAEAEGVDLVLCMSIEPGYSGQTFMPEAIGRIEALRAALPADVRVQVDGGISAGNAREVREAGADLLVAGSAICWSDDPPAAYRRLRAIAEEAA
jgi:ribulose-phosphate 3-epimerase